MYTMNSIVRMGHPSMFSRILLFAALQLISTFRNLVAFGVLLIVSLIELCIAAWITAKYNTNHNFPTSSTRAQVRYLLFMSIWTIVFGTVYLVGFFVAANSVFVSVASHFFLCVLSHSICHLNRLIVFFPNQNFMRNIIYSLFLTWILWLAAAAAITQTLGGALNCHNQTYFVYCSQLNALEGFAWLILCVVIPF